MPDAGSSAPRTLACPACGRLNHSDAHFCQGCGGDLTSATAPTSTDPAATEAAEVVDGRAPPPVDVGPEEQRPEWYRRPAVLTAVALGVLLVAAVAWAIAASTDDRDANTAASTSTEAPTSSTPTTAAATSPVAPAPTPTAPAPTATTPPPTQPGPPAPDPLAAPVITSVTPTCDPDLDPQAPCAITVNWQHPGGVLAFYVVADGADWPQNRVAPDRRSWSIDGLPTGQQYCVRVVALRTNGTGPADEAASAPQCVSTGIG